MFSKNTDEEITVEETQVRGVKAVVQCTMFNVFCFARRMKCIFKKMDSVFFWMRQWCLNQMFFFSEECDSSVCFHGDFFMEFIVASCAI